MVTSCRNGGAERKVYVGLALKMVDFKNEKKGRNKTLRRNAASTECGLGSGIFASAHFPKK